MAFTNQKAWFISTNKYSAVTTWATGVAKSVGDIVRATAPAAGSERCFVCTVAGTTHATTEPTWTNTRGAITTDNGISWQEITGVAAINGDMGNTPTWTTGAKNTAITLGHVIKSDDGTKVLICTVAGTAGNGSEPSWGTTTGVDIADGGSLKWKLLKTGSATFAAFAAPHHHLVNSQAVNWGGTVGASPTLFFVGASHAYSLSTSNTPLNLGTLTQHVDVMCISESFAGSTPVAGDITTGGTETATGSNIQMAGICRVYGMTWKGSQSSGSSIPVSLNDAGEIYYKNCTIDLSGGINNCRVEFHASSSGRTIMEDCTFKFGNASQTIILGYDVEWINCTIDSGGTCPSNLFNATDNGVNSTFGSGSFICRNCDFSFITTNMFRFPNTSCTTSILLQDCKLGSGTITDFSAITTGYAMQSVTVVRSGQASDTKTCRLNYYDARGTVTTETTAVRHGGASDNSQQFSQKMVTSAQINLAGKGLTSPSVSAYNSTTGSTVTATLYGIINATAVPNANDLWAEFDYLGTSSVPQGSRKSTRNGPLDTNSALTADTSAWDDIAAARQNSHAYSQGDMIKSASSAGSLFFCTTAGTTAGSEPGGYTSAVDGTDITDGTAHFRPGCRFKLSKALSSPAPQLAGEIIGTVHATKVSTTYYIDPLLVLT